MQTLVLGGDYLISDHGFDELAEDGIILSEVLAGIATAIVLENYPDRMRGPSVLALQSDGSGRPIHIVWGIPAGRRRPAVLVMGFGVQEAQKAMRRKSIKLIHEGKYAAEVPVELIEDDTAWSPYLTPDDARKLDSVRLALKRGDVAEAAKYGRIFELVPAAPLAGAGS